MVNRAPNHTLHMTAVLPTLGDAFADVVRGYPVLQALVRANQRALLTIAEQPHREGRQWTSTKRFLAGGRCGGSPTSPSRERCSSACYPPPPGRRLDRTSSRGTSTWCPAHCWRSSRS